MLINGKTFFGIDKAQIDHLGKNMPPIWEADPGISDILLDVSKMLMGLPMPEAKKQILTLEGDFKKTKGDNLLELPDYVLTSTALEICSKIKVTKKTVALLQEVTKSIDENDEVT